MATTTQYNPDGQEPVYYAYQPSASPLGPSLGPAPRYSAPAVRETPLPGTLLIDRTNEPRFGLSRWHGSATSSPQSRATAIAWDRAWRPTKRNTIVLTTISWTRAWRYTKRNTIAPGAALS